MPLYMIEVLLGVGLAQLSKLFFYLGGVWEP